MYPVFKFCIHKKKVLVHQSFIQYFTPDLSTNYDNSRFTNYVGIEKEPRFLRLLKGHNTALSAFYPYWGVGVCIRLPNCRTSPHALAVIPRQTTVSFCDGRAYNVYRICILTKISDKRKYPHHNLCKFSCYISICLNMLTLIS